MVFYAQVKSFEKRLKFPGRFYLHDSGNEVFGSNPIPTAKKEFSGVLNKLDGDYLWVIGILWGDRSQRIVEVFFYGGIENNGWPGNPEVGYMQFCSGQLIARSRSLTCGEGLMVLGKEEEFRRSRGCLKDYLNDAPRFASTLVQRIF